MMRARRVSGVKLFSGGIIDSFPRQLPHGIELATVGFQQRHSSYESEECLAILIATNALEKQPLQNNHENKASRRIEGI